MRALLPALFSLLFVLPLHAEEWQEDAAVGIDAKALTKAAPAADAVQPRIVEKLTEDDRAQLKRVEDYFNTIRTLKADFIQTFNDGRIAKGTLALARPGKMRLQYAPPNKDMLVADGAFVHVWDSQAKTSSSVPLGTSLADVILRDTFHFDGDIAVTQMRYYPSMMEIDLVQKDSPAAGTLTLEFQDNPLVLRNWRVTDAQGLQTRVALLNEDVNSKIPSGTFYYRDPDFFGGKK